MPGANCCLNNCSASRRKKGLSFFKLPAASTPDRGLWRKNLLNVITKYRVLDAGFQKQIDDDTVHICSRHFTSDQMICYSTKRDLRLNALPILNLPEKSIPAKPIKERSTSSIIKRSNIHASSTSTLISSCYKDLPEFIARVTKLKLNDTWKIIVEDDHVEIRKNNDLFLLPEFQIFVDIYLDYSLRLFGWLISPTHPLLKDNTNCFKNITLSNFIFSLNSYKICPGINAPSVDHDVYIQRHIIPRVFTFADLQNSRVNSQVRTFQKEYLRANDCHLLVKTENICYSCEKKKIQVKKVLRAKQAHAAKPASVKAPVSLTSPDRLKLTLQNQRLACKKMSAEIAEMRDQISQYAQPVNKEMSDDFRKLISSKDQQKMPPFMKLFWEEQQKYLASSNQKSIRYHPAIIKYCLNLAAKSSSVYEDIRLNKKKGTGILVLPSQRTLRDYRNHIRPQRGFNPSVIHDLAAKVKDFSDVERYICLSFDEMKVQQDLVWDKNTNELIGFIDLGDEDVNLATLKKADQLASSVLVFYIRSLHNPLSFALATFATHGLSSYQIFPIFWKAVAILELQINLKVIAATADGAAPNRRFYKLHQVQATKDGVTYYAENLFAPDRKIYFFSDAPHLLKTSRNCLYNSRFGNTARCMWNNGRYLMWSQISDLYEENLNCGLKLLPKLTYDHVHLTSFSKMNVKIAAQVMSYSVGNVLDSYGSDDVKSTAEFCLDIDKFFDSMNVRNTVEHIVKRKEFLKPYFDANDPRFSFFDNFMLRLEEWKMSIESRDGNFTELQKSAMFISSQTYEGIRINIQSLKEIVPFLLNNGFKYVLTEKLNQDSLENYFGRQRAIGRRKDNPSVYDVGYNDNTIKSQFSVRPVGGNVRDTDKHMKLSCSEPLPKRKKK